MSLKEQDRGLNKDPKKGECIFVLAPVVMHRTPFYRAAVGRVRELHPGAEVVSDAGLFDGLADWRERWPEVLEPAARLYFLTARDGTVGRGLHAMYEHLVRDMGKPATVLFPGPGPDDPFEECADFYLRVIDEDDWKRYAVPIVVTPRDAGSAA